MHTVIQESHSTNSKTRSNSSTLHSELTLCANIPMQLDQQRGRHAQNPFTMSVTWRKRRGDLALPIKICIFNNSNSGMNSNDRSKCASNQRQACQEYHHSRSTHHTTRLRAKHLLPQVADPHSIRETALPAAYRTLE